MAQMARGILLAILLGQLTIPWAWSGQIVSPEDQKWVDQTLQQLEQDKVFPPLESPTTLGLLYFANHTGRADLDPLEKGIVAMLAADLAHVKRIKVVPRGRLQALMSALNLKVTDLTDPVRMPQLGRLLGAAYVLGGTLEQGQLAELDIIPQLLEVPNDILLEQPLVTGDLTELFLMEKRLLDGIIAKMGVNLSPAESAALKTPLSRNSAALNSYFRGLDQSDRGNYQAAFNLYDKALAEDPGLHLAGTAMDELISLGLITAEGTLAQAKPQSTASKATSQADTTPQPGEQPSSKTETSKTETPDQSSPDQPPADEQGKSGSRRGVLIGAGIAAAAIAVVAAGAGGGSSSGDTPSDPPPTDPEAPRVTNTQPENNATDIPRDLTEISFQFSTAMDNSQSNIISDNLTWEINGNAVLEWSDDSETLTLRRMDDEDLPSGEEYQITLTGFVSGEDVALPDFTYSFTVEIY